MTETEKLQETVAHLTKITDDLSEVIARQDKELTDLTRKVALLLTREAERIASSDGGVIMGDERPPHY